MEFITIEVEQREERGSRAMHRLRHAARVPGVLYGLGRRNLPLTVPQDALERFLHSGSHLVELKMGEATRDAILREVQTDPLTDRVLHVDFQRVEKDALVEDDVPVVFKGTAKGVVEGGVFQGLIAHLSVRARPRDLPREILLDVTGLGIGDEIKVADIELPAGVSFAEETDRLVAHCVYAAKKTAVAEEGEAGTLEGEAEPTAEGASAESREG
jgi:large subunit ribosomal protein L25